MKIMINGVNADIRPESEKTIGEVLCVLEKWLSESGFRLSGLNLDGQAINATMMENCFYRDINTVNTLDIITSSLLQLVAESYLNLIQDIYSYNASDSDEKSAFADDWKESPQACFLSEQSPEIYNLALKTFSSDDSGINMFRDIVLERLKELQDPAAEFQKIESIVNNICLRLEELPLDFQTGKDAAAAETINTFSCISEKIFRIINILGMKYQGELIINDLPIKSFIKEFDAVLLQMLSAYQQQDTVLAGDIAEYEIAPRLSALYVSVLKSITGG